MELSQRRRRGEERRDRWPELNQRLKSCCYCSRRPELRHTVTGQISTSLIIVLVGGICLFRFLGQDATNVVIGAEVVIPIATIATFVHLAWVARRPVAVAEPG